MGVSSWEVGYELRELSTAAEVFKFAKNFNASNNDVTLRRESSGFSFQQFLN